MKTIAVIIPYFQRTSGLLAACVKSIIEQKLPDDTSISILIVDDESPVDPLSELAHLAFPANVSFEILTQKNAGPGAARNTGLNAVPEKTEFVAFLDSDDTWFEGHITTAMTALGDDGVFYFSDNFEDEGVTTFERTRYFGETDNSADWEVTDPRVNAFRFKNGMAFKTFLREYISQTSTVVYRYTKFKTLRFDPELRYSGEDHFFWLSIAESGQPVTFSKNVNGKRDKGVSLYRAAYSWDSPKALFRLLGNLMFWKRVGQKFKLDNEQKKVVEERVATARMGISYLIVRNGRQHRANSVNAIFSFAKIDPIGLAASPALIFKAMGLAKKGLLEF